MKKKTIKMALVVLAILAVGFVIFNERISLMIVKKMVSKRMTDPLAELSNDLHVGLCGTGSPFPDPERSAPCNVVVAGTQVLLFDSGSGSPKQLSRMGLNSGLVDHVFLTHFHSDHIDGLGELMMTRWAQRRTDRPLSIHGPTGLTQVVQGFSTAYELDAQYRTAHHGSEVMPPALSKGQVNEFGTVPQQGLEVFNQDGLTVEAFSVDHSPVEPAVAYRITYQGRIAVISGDTVQTEAVVKAASKADLLIHEALHSGLVKLLQDVATESNRPRLAKILYDIPDYHTSPVDAAKVAQAAQTKALVYSHIVPPLPLPALKKIFLEGTADQFNGTIHLGEDGDWITLPKDSREVQFSRRYR